MRTLAYLLFLIGLCVPVCAKADLGFNEKTTVTDLEMFSLEPYRQGRLLDIFFAAHDLAEELDNREGFFKTPLIMVDHYDAYVTLRRVELRDINTPSNCVLWYRINAKHFDPLLLPDHWRTCFGKWDMWYNGGPFDTIPELEGDLQRILETIRRMPDYRR